MAVRHEGLQVRLDVNNVQAGYLAGCSGAARVAYNFAQAVKAHRDWMGGKTGFPRFKSRRDEWSFRVCGTLELRPGRLLPPKPGEVRIATPDARQAKVRRLVRRGRARIVSARVFRDACGEWWASLTVERTTRYEPSADAVPAAVVGVDVGVKTLAVAANSSADVLLTVKGSGDLHRSERKLRNAQRAVSRKDRVHGQQVGWPHPRRSPSRRRADSHRRLARVHRRVRNQRAARLHQLTCQLADTGSVVVIEDLNVRGMTAAGGAASVV